MDLTAKFESARADGIFRNIGKTDTGEVVLVSLEHAYSDGRGQYFGKVPPGTYICERGTHELHDKVPFETFEVMGVPGHSGILFHHGNWNKDSDGCFLLGLDFAAPGGADMVTSSDKAFSAFMALQEGVDTFKLRVEG